KTAAAPEAAAAASRPAVRLKLPDLPYPSLAYYDREHQALFAGRDDDVLRFARMLDDARTRVLLLHGESGVGKSSFLRAGVIPYLEDEGVGYRFFRNCSAAGWEPVLIVRATNDPLAQLAQALGTYCSRDFAGQRPTGESLTIDLRQVLSRAAQVPADNPDALRQALRQDPRLLARILAALGDRLPYPFVLVIDQCEEIYSLAPTPAH